jgi:hypothetical protein
MRALVAVAFLMTGTGCGFAEDYSAQTFYDGNKLYTACQYDQTECVAYAIGVLDTEVTIRALLHLAKQYCLPPNATAGQIGDIVAKYLRDYPGKRQYEASSLVMLAVASAFACN